MRESGQAPRGSDEPEPAGQPDRRPPGDGGRPRRSSPGRRRHRWRTRRQRVGVEPQRVPAPPPVESMNRWCAAGPRGRAARRDRSSPWQGWCHRPCVSPAPTHAGEQPAPSPVSRCVLRLAGRQRVWHRPGGSPWAGSRLARGLTAGLQAMATRCRLRRPASQRFGAGRRARWAWSGDRRTESSWGLCRWRASPGEL